MTPSRPVAAALEAAAGWVDDQIAGGAPAKWVAAQAAESLRWIAGQERDGWPETPDDRPPVPSLAAYRETQTRTREGAA